MVRQTVQMSIVASPRIYAPNYFLSLGRHEIYAPGFYTGYGVKTLPAVREAIEQRDWKEATEQITVVARSIENAADAIDRATQVLK